MRIIVQVVLFLLFCINPSFGQGSRTEYDGYEYEIAENQMAWIEASAFAKSKGGTLVKIETVEQNTWLMGFLASVNTTAQDGGGAIYSWLGGADSVTEGAWLWEDGTQVPFNSSGTVWWGNGPGHGSDGSEPDNFGGTQHCLAIGLSSWPTAAPGYYGTSGQWNDINCSNELKFVIQYLPNVSPSVAISGGNRTIADTDDAAGESVSFTGTATDSDGTIATTQWLVDGSEVATGLTATIALSDGATVVTFKATDNDGASTSSTATITVEVPNVSPSVAISGGNRTIADTDDAAGESVSFTGTATDSDGTIATTQWLVDGSEVATGLTATIALSDGATVVTFKATDNDGASTSSTATITVEVPNVSPSVAISGGNRTIADTDDAAGESVSFTGTATDSDGTIATTQWLVDGSEVATGLTATIALSDGATVVTFKATDNDGASTSSTATITVEVPNVSPSVAISGGNRTIADTDDAAGESVSFTGTATDSDGTIATTQWLVDGSEIATGLSASLSLSDGTTVVTFKATDNLGESSSTTVSITVTAYEQIQQSQREILISIYNATNGSGWTNNTGWNGAVGSECDWYGVTCISGEVYVLDLRSNNLSGTIPAELGNLTSLDNLMFGDNQLNGSIPEELGNLTSLNNLSLENNQLTGSIPSELGNLSNLTGLYLTSNQLTGSIPTELGNLTSLKSLVLNYNQLSGSIPSQLGAVTSLTSLFLNNNQLSGSIPIELGNLSYPRSLYFQDNQLSGSIPAELGNLTSLWWLFLSGNELTGSIPPELGNLSNLKTLKLHDNKLTGLLRSELGNLTALTELRLDNNQLSGSIPAAFSTIPTINVSSNPKLDRNVLIKLYDSTNGDNWTNKSGWNGAVGSECDWYGVTCHYPSIGSSSPYYQHQTIESLRLTSNNLSGTIPTEIGNLCDAERALLGSSACTQLLSFYDNSLTGTIPAELGNLTTLTSLSLTSNQLSGTIPSSLGNLTSLTYLALAINQLTGSIPAELGDLTSLINFRLDGNKLSGVIPTQLSNLTALTELRLNNNKLIGPVPQWLSDMAISSLNTTDAFTSPPIVAISGGNRTIADTDGVAGESVSFTGTATDSDGTIATTQWLVGGSVVATGLSATISLPNRSTVVTFKATDNVGASSTKTVTITVATPTYTVTDEWPSPYNGVTPDSSLGLAFNNIGIYDAAGSTIYTCLRVYTDGLPGSVGGIGEFDIGLTIVSLDEGTVQITKFREFNVIGALNENVELPDCSGKFETTTAVFTDTIETKLYSNFLGNMLPIVKTFETTFDLIDGDNLILKLSSYQELTAN